MRQSIATIRVLWTRELLRFMQERSRIAGAVLQPLLLWWMLGAGMKDSFRLQGAPGISYLEFFYPGVLLMMLLFSSIFATMSLIEDRQQGFLNAVLVAPGSRIAVVTGKSLGGTTIAWLQCLLFLMLVPLAGFHPASIDWPMLLGTLFLVGLMFAFLGFAMAWWLNSTQAYHVLMFLLLIPLWILSGTMFPLPNEGVGRTLAVFNPMVYASDRIRRALYGGELPDVFVSAAQNACVELVTLLVCTAVMFALAVIVCQRKR